MNDNNEESIQIKKKEKSLFIMGIVGMISVAILPLGALLCIPCLIAPSHFRNDPNNEAVHATIGTYLCYISGVINILNLIALLLIFLFMPFIEMWFR